MEQQTGEAANAPITTAPATAEPPAKQAINWAVVAHLSALVSLVGVPSAVGPAIIWYAKRGLHPFVEHHAKEALNFNLSFLIYAVVAGLTLFVLVGLVLLPAVALAWLILMVIAALKAAGGEYYRYPLTIRFFK